MGEKVSVPGAEPRMKEKGKRATGTLGAAGVAVVWVELMPQKLHSALMLAHQCHLSENGISVDVIKGSDKMMEDMQTQSGLKP